MAWMKMNLRDASVFVRCDEKGSPLVDKGRVEIRYQPGKAKAYRASVANLEPIDPSEIYPDDHCAIQATAPAQKGGAKKIAKKASHPTRPIADEVIAYCDGACSGNPGPAGIGAVMRWGEQEQELSEFIGDGTNNIAELMAIVRVLEAVSDRGRPVHIYTDSSYSIGVLTKGWKAKANKALIDDARALLREFSDVEFVHVRGHQGVELNERADALAVQAVQARESLGWVKR